MSWVSVEYSLFFFSNLIYVNFAILSSPAREVLPSPSLLPDTKRDNSLGRTRGTTPFERDPRRDLPEECPCCQNREAESQTPHQTNQYTDH